MLNIEKEDSEPECQSTESLLGNEDHEKNGQAENDTECSMDDIISATGFGPWTIVIFLAPALSKL